MKGPTALTFVRGDAALAAKAVADYARVTQLLPFKGGLMDGSEVDADQIRAISRLPSREVLYGQLVGMVASPISGHVRSLGGLLGGLAVAHGQVQEKKVSGEIPAGEPPAAAAVPAAPEAPAEPEAEEAPAEPEAEAPAEEAAAEDIPPEVALAEDAAPENQTEPDSEPATDDNPTEASAESETAEANKED